jgi:hypothetical protein
MVTVAERRAELRYEIKRHMATARDYERTARGLYQSIDDLTGDDPEDADAARVWSMQASHAEDCAAQAGRYADRARNELADLNERAA